MSNLHLKFQQKQLQNIYMISFSEWKYTCREKIYDPKMSIDFWQFRNSSTSIKTNEDTSKTLSVSITHRGITRKYFKSNIYSFIYFLRSLISTSKSNQNINQLRIFENDVLGTTIGDDTTFLDRSGILRHTMSQFKCRNF